MFEHVTILLSLVFAIALTTPLSTATGLVLARV
jgi:Na+(H+)/acetate symporter ActP